MNTPANNIRAIADDVVQLGQLLIDFAHVERILRHDDGRAENDAEHSYMLAVLAIGVAQAYQPELDVGKVAQYALVHDLVEVITGDTNTLDATAAIIASKEQRERDALANELPHKLAAWPWLMELVREYERLDTPEARFVKVLDKVTPVLYRVRHDASALKATGWRTKKDIEDAVSATTQKLEQVAGNQTFALALRRAMFDVQASLLK